MLSAAVVLQVAAWFAARALQLDAATGQLPAVLQLLELAVSRGYGAICVDVSSSSSSADGTLSRRSSSADGRRGSSELGGVAAATATASGMSISALLTQAQVLVQLVKSWWPVQQQQQPEQPSEQQQQQLPSAAAAAAQAAAALPPLWCVSLAAWVGAGLLPQLMACLGGSNRDLLQQDMASR